jgi:hypothetical protein
LFLLALSLLKEILHWFCERVSQEKVQARESSELGDETN